MNMGYLDYEGLKRYHNLFSTLLNNKQSKITATGLLKGDGSGGVTAAVADTDYQSPLTFNTAPSSSNKVVTMADLSNKADKSEVMIGVEGGNLLDILYSDTDGNLSISSEVLPVSEGKTPIALCIAGEGFFGSNEPARFMSLKYMNYSTPEVGSTSVQDIYVGQYGTNLSLANKRRVSLSRDSEYGYLASDNFTNNVGSDGRGYYTTSDTVPSLLNNDGTWNTNETSGYALGDIDGKSNTQVWLDAATAQSGWQTASTITNTSDPGYSPAACCCARYHTNGTNAGDWYLGAAGEMAMIITNLAAINAKLTQINAIYSSYCISSLDAYCYWSSTESNSIGTYYVDTEIGYIALDIKDISYYVVAMFTLNAPLSLKDKVTLLESSLATVATMADVPTEMIASGSGHKGGLVPDPGATQGTTKYLREDGTWAVPEGNTDLTDYVQKSEIYEQSDGYVDLGLPSGLLWATGNIVKDTNGNYSIGEETDYGCYFSWGNIDGHNNGESYDFGTKNFGEPYVSSPGRQVSTDISITDSSHDAALACLGSPWHLPTKDNCKELYDNTDREWTTIDGINGYKFMKKTDHSVYVFFPAAGYGDGTSIVDVGIYGYYWSSSWDSNSTCYSMNFSSSQVDSKGFSNRYSGISVRAVANTTPPPAPKYAQKSELADVASVKEDKMTVVTQSSGTTLTAAVGNYYRFTYNVGTLDITLPTPTGSNAQSVLFFLTTGASPNVTFTSSGNTIYKNDGFAIDATTTYEINALWNGGAWVINAVKYTT